MKQLIMLFAVIVLSSACGDDMPQPTRIPTSLPATATAPGTPVPPPNTPIPAPLVRPTNTPLPTNTPEPTATPTPAPTNTPPPTETPIPTPTLTATPAPTNTPLPTETPIPTPTLTATPAPTNTPLPTETPIPTVPPTATPIPTSTPTPSPTPYPTNTWVHYEYEPDLVTGERGVLAYIFSSNLNDGTRLGIRCWYGSSISSENRYDVYVLWESATVVLSGGLTNVIVKFNDDDLQEEQWSLYSSNSLVTEAESRATTFVPDTAVGDFTERLKSASRLAVRLYTGDDQYINAVWEDLMGFEEAFGRLTARCGVESLATPTPTPAPVPTAIVLPTATPTPVPTPAWDVIGEELKNTANTWRKEHLFHLLAQMVDSPLVANQYTDKVVTIQGEYSSRRQNVLRMWWTYGEPIERTFSVSCMITKDLDVKRLARLDALEDDDPLVTFKGLLKGSDYDFSQPIRVGDSGLSLSITLDDCQAIAIDVGE